MTEDAVAHLPLAASGTDPAQKRLPRPRARSRRPAAARVIGPGGSADDSSPDVDFRRTYGNNAECRQMRPARPLSSSPEDPDSRALPEQRGGRTLRL